MIISTVTKTDHVALTMHYTLCKVSAFRSDDWQSSLYVAISLLTQQLQTTNTRLIWYGDSAKRGLPYAQVSGPRARQTMQEENTLGGNVRQELKLTGLYFFVQAPTACTAKTLVKHIVIHIHHAL